MSATSYPQANGSVPASERDAHGRFATGNKGGPGNPFARKTAALRQALLDAVTPQDMRIIAQNLLRGAQGGHLPSTKLLLAYLLGKPAATPNPDQLDQEEWQLFKNTAGMFREMPKLLTEPDPGLPLDILRNSRSAMADELGSRTFRMLVNPAKEMAKLRSACAGDQRYPAPLREFLGRAYPSANGTNGVQRSAAASAGSTSGGHAGPGRNGQAAKRKGRPSANGKNGSNGKSGHGGTNGRGSAVRTPADTAVATLLKKPPSANGV